MKKFTLMLGAMLLSMMSFAAVITFTPGEFDALESSKFDVVKEGVTLSCSSGTITADQFRFFKSQTLTVSSTAGNITSIEFTCTAANDTKHGPGGFGALDGYTYADKVGTWTGSAASVTFSTTNNQVRATQVVVTIDGEGGGDNPGGDNPGGDDPNPGTGDVVEITGLQYADAYYYEYEGIKFYDIDLYKNLDEESYDYIYPELYIIVEANSKTALNGTYDLRFAGLWASENDSVMIGEEVGTVTIKNTDNEGNYSFKGSYVGEDGKTYKFDQVVEVYAYDADADYEDITLNENGGDTPGDNPGDDPVTPPAGGGVTFDADVDKGNATETRAAYEVAKEGITMSVTDGRLGTYNNEVHYRIYKSATMTLTSTVGNIVSVEFTCTAKDDAEYGPGCLTASTGDYTYSGAVGTWTGNAASVVFTAATAQVRASQIVVKIAGGATGVEDVTTVVIPVKVMQNGQLMIIRGEKTYNVMGAQL